MGAHTTGTREEWRKARIELLEAEKELTRRGDELAREIIENRSRTRTSRSDFTEPTDARGGP